MTGGEATPRMGLRSWPTPKESMTRAGKGMEAGSKRVKPSYPIFRQQGKGATTPKTMASSAGNGGKKINSTTTEPVPVSTLVNTTMMPMTMMAPVVAQEGEGIVGNKGVAPAQSPEENKGGTSKSNSNNSSTMAHKYK
jgi:hypothetical protein